MEMKKCHYCGENIPAELDYCLKCNKRPDGVLEIRKKTVPACKYIITAIIVFAVMAVTIVILFINLKKNNKTSDVDKSPAPVVTESHMENTVPPDIKDILTEKLLTLYGKSCYELSFDESTCEMMCFTTGVAPIKFRAVFYDDS